MTPISNLSRPTLTAADVASELDVSQNTIRRWTREGKFPKPTRVGKFCRWRQEDIDRFLAAGNATS